MKDVNNELMNQKLNEEEQVENERSNKFNLIIGVSTLLIAILGATFAYFSATARSDEGDVNVRSAYVSISYDGGTEIKASNLIPSKEEIAIHKFQKNVNPYGTADDETLTFLDQDSYKNDLDRRCIDANGHEVCYVYQFTINSDGEAGGETAITGYITVDSNEFDNLSYTVYEVTFQKNEAGKELVDAYGNKLVASYTPINGDSQEYFLSKIETDDGAKNIGEVENISSIINNNIPTFSMFGKPFDLKGENGEVIRTAHPVECLFGYSDDYSSLDVDDPARCKSYKLSNQVSHTYQVMVWLQETGDVQPEQGLTFSGTVSLEVPGGQDATEEEMITGKD